MEDKTFFYPNACHVCKRWDIKLMTCARCQMISYCNEKHKKEHLPQHQKICSAIKLALEEKKYMNTEEISVGKWLYIRQTYMNKVADILQRKLKAEEREMFIYPKACLVCHSQETVIRCNDCPSAAFCDKHRDESRHRHNCTQMRECFKICKSIAPEKMIDVSYIARFFNKTRDFHNMRSFLDIYVPLEKNNVHLRKLHSEVVSMPLTVYFCIKKLDYFSCETLSIHVMGPYITKYENDFKIWAMLLCLIPNLTTLTITFIQTESMFSKCDISGEVLNVSDTKKLVMNVRCMSYKEYMGTADFKKPNFIVGSRSFVTAVSYAKMRDVGISEKSGRVLVEKRCPCILIFGHMQPSRKQMLNKMKKHFFGINPFMSLVPYRYPKTGRICYANNYLIIFTNLDSSNVFINKENCCVLFTKTTRE